MQILVIYAHPDDAEFGCAGTIAKMAKKNEVSYLSVTSGECGIEGKASISRKRAIREREQRAAAKILGVKKVFFLREKDCQVENTPKLRNKIVRVIRKVRPNIVFAFDPSNIAFDNVYLFHADHRNAGIAAFDAVYPLAGNKNFGSGRPHKVGKLYFFGTQKPNKWINISNTINVKIRALLAHKSQITPAYRINMRKHVMKLSKNKKKGMKYSEAFRVLEFPEGS